ncbi:hypothetical protein BKA62DRAFT_780462 [Auriculariales sp. MPI-PUGE-AT-0066]|nr:hypothetical protein BKA62DRAFT_780462 [Auriculariales sp. MPI-PUGE-AT-0066]
MSLIAPYSGHSSTESTPSPSIMPTALPHTLSSSSKAPYRPIPAVPAPTPLQQQQQRHTQFLPQLPLADLFAPHADGRHSVCRVCKAMLSGTTSAQRGHLMVFHRAGGDC